MVSKLIHCGWIIQLVCSIMICLTLAAMFGTEMVYLRSDIMWNWDKSNEFYISSLEGRHRNIYSTVPELTIYHFKMVTPVAVMVFGAGVAGSFVARCNEPIYQLIMGSFAVVLNAMSGFICVLYSVATGIFSIVNAKEGMFKSNEDQQSGSGYWDWDYDNDSEGPDDRDRPYPPGTMKPMGALAFLLFLLSLVSTLVSFDQLIQLSFHGSSMKRLVQNGQSSQSVGNAYPAGIQANQIRGGKNEEV